MAVNNLKKYKDKDGIGFPLNFRRGNPNPLDNSSVWSSLEDAKTYAMYDPTAYVGQILTVVDSDGRIAIHYSIQNEAGVLKRLDSLSVDDENAIISAIESAEVRANQYTNDAVANIVNLIPMATIDMPGIVKSSNDENFISVLEDGTMLINNVNLRKIVQTEEDELILDGGNSGNIK
ncbi:MAG: hypothetical protein IJ022_07690 [Burkholderiaceae bacterium]|nr:hypothetical protein [Burkholderiaceae bacterium]